MTYIFSSIFLTASPLVTLAITLGVALAIILLSIFVKRIRRFFLLFIASQIPMTYISVAIMEKPKGWSFGWLEIILWTVFFIGAVALAYWSARRYKIIPPIHWKYFRIGRGLLGGTVLVLIQLVISFSFIALFPHMSQSTTANQAQVDAMGTMMPYLIFAITVVSAGFFEELVFRVGVFELLLPKHKNWAFLVSTFIFAGMHMTSAWTGHLTIIYIQSWIIYGTMSIILTAFYYKYRNFYLNMTIHAFLNLYGTVILPFVLVPLLKMLGAGH